MAKTKAAAKAQEEITNLTTDESSAQDELIEELVDAAEEAVEQAGEALEAAQDILEELRNPPQTAADIQAEMPSIPASFEKTELNAQASNSLVKDVYTDDDYFVSFVDENEFRRNPEDRKINVSGKPSWFDAECGIEITSYTEPLGFLLEEFHKYVNPKHGFRLFVNVMNPSFYGPRVTILVPLARTTLSREHLKVNRCHRVSTPISTVADKKTAKTFFEKKMPVILGGLKYNYNF